jgi:protocatechuate 3,4-dioxygenase beta subunit
LEALVVRWLAIAFACLVVAATSPSQTDAPKEAQKQSIQGKVVEVKSGQPIRKASVEVMGGTGQTYERHSATTGADGTFTIEDLKPGRYAVTLEHAGFVQTATSRGQGTFTLQPGQSLTGLVFRMQAAGVISGKIVDMDGDQMAGVSVNAAMAGTLARGVTRYGSGNGITNDLGEYRIADLRPGKYLILAQPPQRAPAVHAEEKEKAKERLTYASTYYPGTLDKTRAIAVEVRAGEEAAANFGALTARTYRVSGIVAGAPSGMMVRLFLLSKNGGAGMDSPGELREGNRFEYQNILPGTYQAMLLVVKGLSGGGQPDMQMVQLTPPIEVDKSDVEGVQLHSEPGRQIHGKFRLDTEESFDWTQLNVSLLPIVEDTSEAFSGMAMTAAGYSQTSTNSPVSADGTFEVKNVLAGNYQLVAGARSDSLRDYYTKSVIVGGKDMADSGFAVSGDMYLDVVVSAKGATIEGNVVRSKGEPVAYGVVAVLPNTEHRTRPDSYQQVPTDEYGHFIARGLNPGSYVVLAFEELQEDMRQPEFLKTYGGKGEKVELEEGARKRVTTKVIPAETEAP